MNGSARTAVIGLLVYLLAAIALGAVLAFPVHAGLQRLADPAFDAVLQRVAALCLLLLLPLYLAAGVRAEPLRAAPAAALAKGLLRPRGSPFSRDAFGFGCSARTFRRGFGGGFVLGILVVLPLAAAFLALGVRAPARTAPSAADVTMFFAYALLGAALIGLIEEAYFRGALLAPLRHLSTRLAISIVGVVYAVVHFLGAPVPDEQTSWSSGWTSLARSDVPLDAFLALLAAGLFLGALRHRFGHIAVGAGFHAGWVFVMRLNQEYTDVVPSSDLRFLEGAFGGTMGYLGFAWITLLGIAWYAHERRARARRANEPAMRAR